jgi:hypothetical protein
MASKRRSGLANDRRAFNYYYPKISVIYPKNESEPVCPSISLADIATLVGTTYTLNANTTILACQTIIIPAGYELVVPNGFTLTNYGRINNQGTIAINGTIINYYILYNNGGSIFCNSAGNIINNNGSIIYNGSGTIFTVLGAIYNNGGVIYNIGTFNTNSTGVIYNYNNGTISNDNSFNITGGANLYNADGSSTCGTGILNGNFPPTATGTNCPP